MRFLYASIRAAASPWTTQADGLVLEPYAPPPAQQGQGTQARPKSIWFRDGVYRYVQASAIRTSYWKGLVIAVLQENAR